MLLFNRTKLEEEIKEKEEEEDLLTDRRGR